MTPSNRSIKIGLDADKVFAVGEKMAVRDHFARRVVNRSNMRAVAGVGSVNVSATSNDRGELTMQVPMYSSLLWESQSSSRTDRMGNFLDKK